MPNHKYLYMYTFCVCVCVAVRAYILCVLNTDAEVNCGHTIRRCVFVIKSPDLFIFDLTRNTEVMAALPMYVWELAIGIVFTYVRICFMCVRLLYGKFTARTPSCLLMGGGCCGREYGSSGDDENV